MFYSLYENFIIHLMLILNNTLNKLLYFGFSQDMFHVKSKACAEIEFIFDSQ